MKKLFALFMVTITITTMLSGCVKTPNKDKGSDNVVTFTDDMQHTVTVDNPQKIAVCMGSFAETWVLAGGELGFVTQDAYDEHLFEVPSTAVNLGLMKSPSIEMMIAEGVDFAILSSKIAEHVDIYDTLKNAGISTAYFNVEDFDDYLNMLKICTNITGKTDLYDKNGLQIQSEIDKAIAKSSGKESPSVLYIRAFSSGAKAKGSDSLAGSMLANLNSKNIADTDNALLDNLSIEAIIKADPEFIFVTTMGSDEEKALKSLDDTIKSSPAWSELSAVKNGKYIVLPKSLYHYKPNAKWGEAYENLANILYGE